MEEREYAYDSGIHIDICPQCKDIFVSAQDLAEIRQFLHTSQHSKEAQMARVKALSNIRKLEDQTRERQSQLAQEIDDLFFADDWGPLNDLSEWLIAELVDVDSFPIANN